MYLAYLLTFFLAFYLAYLWRFFVVEVQRRTLIRSSRWRPGGERSDPVLVVGSGGEHCDLALAVKVRRRRRKEKGEAGQLT